MNSTRRDVHVHVSLHHSTHTPPIHTYYDRAIRESVLHFPFFPSFGIAQLVCAERHSCTPPSLPSAVISCAECAAHVPMLSCSMSVMVSASTVSPVSTEISRTITTSYVGIGSSLNPG